MLSASLRRLLPSSAALSHLVPLLALAIAPPVLHAQDYGPEKPAPVPAVSIPLTSGQKAALHAVDVRMAGVEALAAKIDDPEYKVTVGAALDDLKKRRAALEKTFDPGLYETLMHSVISRYQTVALWLAPPRIPSPGATPVPLGKPAAPVEKKTETKSVSR